MYLVRSNRRLGVSRKANYGVSRSPNIEYGDRGETRSKTGLSPTTSINTSPAPSKQYNACMPVSPRPWFAHLWPADLG